METTALWKIEDLVWNYLAYHTSSNVWASVYREYHRQHTHTQCRKWKL